MCTDTTVGPRRDPHLPSTARTSSARASPTSCSPGSGPGPTSSCARCWAHTPAGSPPCMPGPAVGRRSRCAVSPRRVYLVVATAAAVVHLGVLWNGFALDDLTIIVANPLVHSLSGVWRAFAAPYFPANLDVSVYRPLTIATYALDWSVGSTVWFHAVNLMWHVGARELGGPCRSVHRCALVRAPRVRRIGQPRARVPRPGRAHDSSDGDRCAGGRGPAARLPARAQCRLFSQRAHRGPVAGGRPADPRGAGGLAVGPAAGPRLATPPQARGVGAGLDCDRLRTGGEPALPDPDLDRRADALPPVRGAGARPRGCDAGAHGAVARGRGHAAL